jgi:SNF2 family DNA or RNA helicase
LIVALAHHIRNRTSQLFAATYAINSRYRWCLTGTPIHNTLDDYGALLAFLHVPTFADKPSFDSWITTPILNKDSEGFRSLQRLVKATCLRRTKGKIGQSFNLPARTEETVYVNLSPRDQELYDFFKKKTIDVATGMQRHNPEAVRTTFDKKDNIIVLLNSLRQICNHGQQLLSESAASAWNARNNTAMVWQTMKDERRSYPTSNVDSPSAKIEALLSNLQLSRTSEYHHPPEIPTKRYRNRCLLLIQLAADCK